MKREEEKVDEELDEDVHMLASDDFHCPLCASSFLDVESLQVHVQFACPLAT
jgi:hypothetical protein